MGRECIGNNMSIAVRIRARQNMPRETMHPRTPEQQALTARAVQIFHLGIRVQPRCLRYGPCGVNGGLRNPRGQQSLPPTTTTSGAPPGAVNSPSITSGCWCCSCCCWWVMVIGHAIGRIRG